MVSIYVISEYSADFEINILIFINIKDCYAVVLVAKEKNIIEAYHITKFR